jgi:hypothetical protein
VTIKYGIPEMCSEWTSLTRLQQALRAYGERYGCRPLPRLQNEWPLGIGRIKQIWDANNDSRLMELFP